ncbi:hypothetical protein NPX13_g8746 [Xylaria arbuscula]|uniref:Uncharacterized protein n=1 Tax=Xylaria arbuscula TaxID=114810 RepID=A0A9W8N7V9_9PEZI|nr:hypothetical protein NPX13_g8746 [Xylaria arbuscula]
MVLVARDDLGSGAGSGSNSMVPGRDISRMFRTQEDKLREWTVYDTSPILVGGTTSTPPPPPSITANPSPHNPNVNNEGELGRDIEMVRDEGTDRYGRDDAVIEGPEVVGEEEKEEERRDEDEMKFQVRSATGAPSIAIPSIDNIQNGGHDDGVWDEDDIDGDDTWEEEEQTISDSHKCRICGHAVPIFAMSAHERFHNMDE